MKSLLLLMGVFVCAAAGAETSLDWMSTVAKDGRHNAFTDLVRWQDQYYVCFRHGDNHMSMDGEIRVMRSADMKTWEPCGVLDTFGDDRDPHFAATNDTLYVYFGTWDLQHDAGNGLPDRGGVRSYFASSADGTNWSKIQGVYESGWWLWRVRWHDGAFYSAAYTAHRPKPEVRETRFLKSEDGLNWSLVSVAFREASAGEADMLFADDGSVRMFTRTNEGTKTSYWLQSDPARAQWTAKDSGVMVHAPAFAMWKDRLFVSGRGKGEKGSVTRIWEVKGDELVELITLPSGGDTSYPGLMADPASLEGDVPGLFVTWYSQHENGGEKKPAAVYAGRVSVMP
ncbi:MAG: sialidase family protein [FCB group bacterium]|jgi:hypothetical protein|nr:sialidase family protein [FCB group bacterium]